MNERIRELVEQATIYIAPTSNSGEGWVFNEEKFAELIVKECAKIGELKEQGHQDYDTNTSVGWYMKRHFGIEK
jgi:hypothetical protein